MSIKEIIMRSQSFSDRQAIDDIIRKCEVCNVGMVDEQNMPYVLPFNFGYDGEFLYLHSDPAGRKVEVLKNNPKVCISFSTDHELFHRDDHVACSYGMRYRSVLLYGTVETVEDDEGKINALNLIMKHYTGTDDFKYNAPAVRNVKVFRVYIQRLDGRSYGFREG